MKILVINTGSSSIKYQLFDMGQIRVLAAGLLERIGEGMSKLTHEVYLDPEKPRQVRRDEPVNDHRTGMTMIVRLLADPLVGVIRDTAEISAIGHRVVHGGESFQEPALIDEHVLLAVKTHAALAPLHNPPNLVGIEVAREFFPGVPQVAVFDTAFHQTMPARAFHYGLPHDLYEQHHLRRYGFHGTSHQFVARQAAAYLKQPLGTLNLITVHLGNGASITAIEKGKSVDTSMGLTPLEGLLMGTRCGDLDPGIVLFLSENLKMSASGIDTMLNKQSGFLGICGVNDMREVLRKRAEGDERAGLAFDIYCYRIKKYIGAYYAVLGQVQAVVFTGGIGENSAEVRAQACSGLEQMGIELDPEKNRTARGDACEIQSDKSRVMIMVIHTNEELEIARQTFDLINEKWLPPRICGCSLI